MQTVEQTHILANYYKRIINIVVNMQKLNSKFSDTDHDAKWKYYNEIRMDSFIYIQMRMFKLRYN